MKTKVAEFNIQDMLPLALVLIVTGIGIAFGQNIMADISSGFTAGTYEANSTASAQQGVDKLASKLPLIGTVLVAVIVIGLVVTNLFIRFR